MAALREIKERIGSVGSTLKTTSAMKMVASAKFHRVQGASSALLAYQKSLARTMEVLCADTSVKLHSPFVQPRPERSKVIVVALSSDTSLCGAFNSQIIKATQHKVAQLEQEGLKDIAIWPIGEKIAQAVNKWKYPVCNNYRNISSQLSDVSASKIADALMEAFIEGKADEIHIMYNHFYSMGRQEPTHTQFLPFSLSEINAQESKMVAQDYICEPSKEKIFESLLPYLMRCKIYSLLLNSSTAEFAARTVAMQSASDNAQELLDELKLGYNKRRQQAITEELADIANSQ